MSAHKHWVRMPEGEGLELVLYELLQVGLCSGFSLVEEDGGELLHQAIRRALLGEVTLVVQRGHRVPGGRQPKARTLTYVETVMSDCAMPAHALAGR